MDRLCGGLFPGRGSSGGLEVLELFRDVVVRELVDDLFGPVDDDIGEAGQAGDLNAVALVGAAPDDLSQENNVVPALTDRDAVVFDAGDLALELCEFVVVGREQGLGAKKAPVADVFDDRPGNAHAVVGRGAAADLIQDQEAFGGRIAENVGDLVHLDHEGALTAPQVIRGAHAGKDPVCDTQAGLVGGDKASDLGHQDDEGDLTHVGGFAGHIGAGDDADTVLFSVQQRVVGDEFARLHLLDDRVASGCDPDGPALVEDRPDVTIAFGDKGQGGVDVQMGQGGCSPLKIADPGGAGFADAAEGVVFQCVELVLRIEDAVLQLLEALGGIALGSDQGLFADVVVRDQVLEGIGDLEIIAENLIVFDAQVLDAGPLPVLSLQVHEPLPAVVPGVPQVVDVGVEAGADHPALADGDRRFIDDGLLEKPGQVAEVSDPVPEPGQALGKRARGIRAGRLRSHICRREFSPGRHCAAVYVAASLRRLCSAGSRKDPQDLFDRLEHAQGVTQGDQVPGIGGLIGDPGHQTLQVIDRAEILAQLVPVHTLPAQGLHTVQTGLDLRPLRQGLLQKAVQEPGAHGRAGLVQHPEKRAALFLVAEGLGQLQIAPGGAVQQHVFAGGIGPDPGQVGQGVFLCVVEIAQQSAGGQGPQGKIRKSQREEGRRVEMLQQE